MLDTNEITNQIDIFIKEIIDIGFKYVEATIRNDSICKEIGDSSKYMDGNYLQLEAILLDEFFQHNKKVIHIYISAVSTNIELGLTVIFSEDGLLEKCESVREMIDGIPKK